MKEFGGLKPWRISSIFLFLCRNNSLFSRFVDYDELKNSFKVCISMEMQSNFADHCCFHTFATRNRMK